MLGATAAVNGALLLALPGAFLASSYGPIRPQAGRYGLALLGAGVALLVCHLSDAVPRKTYLAVHTLATALFLAWAAIVMVPNRAWTGIVFYAGFGALVGILPWRTWLEERSRPVGTAGSGAGPGQPGATISSLRARLALALAGAAAIPLILAAVVISRQEGQAAVDEALVQQQTMAGVLAQDAGQYIGLHRSAVVALAGRLGLLEPEPAAQAALLRTVSEAYPAFVFLGTFDAEGRGLTGGQERPPPPGARFPIFDEVRRSGGPVIDVLNRPELAQGPVFAVAAPILQGEQFAGVVLGAVEATRLSDVLARPRVGVAGETYLVDARGRAIAHPDTALVAQLADLSGLPPVAAVLGADGEAQSLRYRGWSGERLAGAARVPGLGWGIVVERPISTVLANSYTRRDSIFAVLVLAIAGAAGAGLFAAGKLTRSLAVLAERGRRAGRGAGRRAPPAQLHRRGGAPGGGVRRHARPPGRAHGRAGGGHPPAGQRAGHRLPRPAQPAHHHRPAGAPAARQVGRAAPGPGGRGGRGAGRADAAPGRDDGRGRTHRLVHGEDAVHDRRAGGHGPPALRPASRPASHPHRTRASSPVTWPRSTVRPPSGTASGSTWPRTR